MADDRQQRSKSVHRGRRRPSKTKRPSREAEGCLDGEIRDDIGREIHGGIAERKGFAAKGEACAPEASGPMEEMPALFEPQPMIVNSAASPMRASAELVSSVSTSNPFTYARPAGLTQSAGD